MVPEDLHQACELACQAHQCPCWGPPLPSCPEVPWSRPGCQPADEQPVFSRPLRPIEKPKAVNSSTASDWGHRQHLGFSWGFPQRCWPSTGKSPETWRRRPAALPAQANLPPSLGKWKQLLQTCSRRDPACSFPRRVRCPVKHFLLAN